MGAQTVPGAVVVDERRVGGIGIGKTGLEELEAKATTSQATAEDVERFAAALAENDNPAFKMKAAALRNRVR